MPESDLSNLVWGIQGISAISLILALLPVSVCGDGRPPELTDGPFHAWLPEQSQASPVCKGAGCIQLLHQVHGRLVRLLVIK